MKQGLKLFTIKREHIVCFSDSEALLTNEGIKHMSSCFTNHFKVVNNKVVLNPGIHFVPIDSIYCDDRLNTQVEYTSNEFKSLCVVRTYTQRDIDEINKEINNTMSSWCYSPAGERYMDTSISFETIGYSLKFVKN